MKKIFNLILASSVALGFAACNNDKAPQVENANEGTTYAGMYISGEKSIAPRDLSQTDETGRDTEGKLNNLDLLSTGGDKSWNFAASGTAEGTFWPTTPDSKIYKVASWKTTPGTQTMALIVNKGILTPNIGSASAQVYGSTATAAADIAALSTDDKFVMTSTVTEKTIADDKAKTAVDAADDEATNVFKFDLERVVAQGMVAKAADLNGATKDGKGKIELATLKYAAVNGAAKTYLFAKNAGDRQMSGENSRYENFKSAIDDYAEFENAKEADNVKNQLIRLGNIKDNQGGYAAIAVANDVAAAKSARGIYFLENSVKKDAFTPANKNFGFYRMAYAKIYAKFTPNKVYKWNEEKNVMEETETLTVTDGTFYKGVKDNLLYDSKASAEKSNIAPGQEAFTYKKGMCAYRALWNRQMDTTGKLVSNADVRRNNIYLLTITEFQGIGMPWDPSDPNDPNLPKPGDDPDDDPDNPDIEESETYMRVEATVLPWNLVSRNISLK